MTSEQKEREAFEKYMRKKHGNIHLTKATHSLMTYMTADAEAFWELWQAARAHQAQPDGELVERVKQAMRDHEHFFKPCSEPWKSIFTDFELDGLAKAALSALPPQPAAQPDSGWRDNPTPEEARNYIANFSKHVLPGATYADFPSGRIHFDKMTDEQAIKLAYGLMEIEEKAAKGAILS